MNPWNDISLDDYENHMSLSSVHQLQALNRIMKDQFFSVGQLIKGDDPGNPDKERGKVMILGIAGGNGLEHVVPDQFEKIYGVDVNPLYLTAVRERYQNLGDMLECIELDLITGYKDLPKADCVIADLLIEYIGYEAFQNVIRQVGPEVVSCVIQINPETDWVSDSPYLHAFDGLEKIHNQIEEELLYMFMKEIGFDEVDAFSVPLPNGKKLCRIDFHNIPEAMLNNK